MQGLEDLYQAHGDRGFSPISVIVQDALGGTPEPEDAGIWADGLDLSFPVLADVDETFFPVWDPAGVLPMATIIDPEGVVAWTEVGGAGGLEEMEAAVVALLGD